MRTRKTNKSAHNVYNHGTSKYLLFKIYSSSWKFVTDRICEISSRFLQISLWEIIHYYKVCTLCYYACTPLIYFTYPGYAKILKVDLWNTCTLFSEKSFFWKSQIQHYIQYTIFEVHIFCGLATGKFHWQIDLVMPFIFVWSIVHHHAKTIRDVTYI